MRASRTHFERIPVETVKKIAKDIPDTGVEQALDEIAPPQERWKETAKRVQEERDPNKLSELVTQLLREFDEGKLLKASGSVETNILNQGSTPRSITGPV
jgi:hypothetical protein